MKPIRISNPKQILQVYSGLDGKCCCGCAGRYWYGTGKANSVARDNGYAPSPEDCSDRMVAKVIRLINEAPIEELEITDSYLARVIGARLYIAYLDKEFA